jgi:hypothetical protein
MEIRIEMLFRYLITRNHPQLHDVPTHVHADVYPHMIFTVSVAAGFARSLAKRSHRFVQILYRGLSCALHTSRHARTSTRIPILSP